MVWTVMRPFSITKVSEPSSTQVLPQRLDHSRTATLPLTSFLRYSQLLLSPAALGPFHPQGLVGLPQPPLQLLELLRRRQGLVPPRLGRCPVSAGGAVACRFLPRADFDSRSFRHHALSPRLIHRSRA